MSKPSKRVLLVLGWYDYRLHRGIEKYAIEHGWRLFGNLAREKVIPWGWKGDGILAWLGADDDFAEFVVETRKPTVDFSCRRPRLKFPRVLEDHAHAARLVAEHFMERGFRRFLFYSDTNNWSYEERGEGFQKALKAGGHQCEWLRWHRSDAFTTDRRQWSRKMKWLTARLRKAEKPVGVFAANDEHALDVLEAAERAGLAVPEEVAIVGAEDNLLAPDAMPTPLSSVDTNLEQLGYRGAELLHDRMNRIPAPQNPVRVPAARVIPRKSSDLIAVKHDGVARSLRFIREHVHEPISVDDLARVAAMSRRGLHKAFVDQLQRTPGRELTRARMEFAKRLLIDTEYKVEVVSRMCGYQSPNSFFIAFKQETGTSPGHYRHSFAS